MLDFVKANPELEPLRTVEFSEIPVGDLFMTDRWIWQKVDPERAKALGELMERSSELKGSIVDFRPWSEVQPLISL
ncbi:MAG: hypothetical protein ACU843_07655 [Gammaproteobacteria bacterium]